MGRLRQAPPPSPAGPDPETTPWSGDAARSRLRGLDSQLLQPAGQQTRSEETQ